METSAIGLLRRGTRLERGFISCFLGPQEEAFSSVVQFEADLLALRSLVASRWLLPKCG